MNFRHSTTTAVYLERYIDKRVFGTWRAVTETRRKDTYRIKDGNVQVKFRGKWENVVENNEATSDRVRAHILQASIDAGKPYYGAAAFVRLD